jgi:putative ABC transport system substrate-binding protein
MALLLEPNFVGAKAERQALETAAQAMGRQIVVIEAANEGEFDGVSATIARSGAGALLVGGGPLFIRQRRQLVALVARHAIPAMYVLREYVEAGGLMSYGASQTHAYRRAGIYVSRLLKGDKPGDLPVELPSKFELVINLATAKGLGVTIPPGVLAIADEVIE